MSLSDRITKQFSVFYDEIELEMSRLRTSDSIFSRLSMQSDDAKILNKYKDGEITSEEVDGLLKTANAFDSELKTFIEKNNLRKKVAARKQKMSMISKVPPIWDDSKLTQYFGSIVDEAFDSCNQVEEENLELLPVASVENVKIVPRPILKTQKSQATKRNASTNVKFQIHPLNPETRPSVPIRATNKKLQSTPSVFKLHPSKACTEIPSQATRTLNRDGSVDVHFAKPCKTVSKLQSRTAPPMNLKISPVQITSTKKEANVHVHQKVENEVKVASGNLATLSKAKQMTKHFMPVISIKGSCSIQKIFQLEISPASDEPRKNSNEFGSQANTKFVEIPYEPPSKPPQVEQQTRTAHPQENSAVIVENEHKVSILDVRDVGRALNDYGVHLRDGKIHVVVESGHSKRKTNIKKMKARKSFKPSTLKKPKDGNDDDLKTTQTDDDVDNESKKINIDTINAIVPGQEEGGNEDKINEKDSSMSSSITDDGKIRQILRINRDVERNRCGPSLRRDSSSGSSAADESSLQPPISFSHAQSSIRENFQSIYKLIEDTFQVNLEASEVSAEINESTKEIDDGMSEMREIIKMSEENIKRAGNLLQKYQTTCEPAIDEKKFQDTSVEVTQRPKDEMKENEKKCCHQEIQTSDSLTFSNYSMATEVQKESQQPTKEFAVDRSAQTDECVQTDDTFNSKSREYFGSVFDAYSNFKHIKFNQPPASLNKHDPFSPLLGPCNCVGCQNKPSMNQLPSQHPIIDSSLLRSRLNQLKLPSTPPKLSVPYNPIYEGDDEVMEAANKFLRSVEKQKKRNGSGSSTSSDSLTSRSFTPQKVSLRRNSSSVSTPSSSLINNVMHSQQSFLQHPIPRPRINLEDKLQDAAVGFTSIEQKLVDVGSLTGEQPTYSKNLSPTADSPQLATDFQANQDFLDRYLSEGEVLSQGEIQLGLSDDEDDAPDDDF